MPLLPGRYSLWESPCKEIHAHSDSYLLSVKPLLCQVWGFTLSTLFLAHSYLQCQRVVTVLWCKLVMHMVCFLYLASQVVLPSFLSSGFLWCPTQKLPAGQLYNGNTFVPGKVLPYDMAAEMLIPHRDQHSKPFGLNIRKIVLPHIWKTSKCCGTYIGRCLNPCYIGSAD